LLKEILTEAAVAEDDVTDTSFEVAVARATVAASITLNLPVPAATADIGQ
jgi:hypothetical protein